MVQALIIGAAQRQQIAELCAVAATNPLDALATLATAGRDLDGFRDMMKMLTLELPRGYVVTYSHEIQPEAPPPGLCHHISISVTRPWKLPSPEAVEIILSEFGMKPIKGSESIWVETIDPKTKAINIVQLLAPT